MELHILVILGKPQHQYSLYPKQKNRTVAEVCQGQIRSECPGHVSDYRWVWQNICLTEQKVYWGDAKEHKIHTQLDKPEQCAVAEHGVMTGSLHW